jgi:hypothetical protein
MSGVFFSKCNKRRVIRPLWLHVFFGKNSVFKKPDAGGSLFRNNEKSHRMAFGHPMSNLTLKFVL